jgi:Anti-sigma-K factor rskA
LSERIGTKKLSGTAKPVNPQFHDEFVALFPLYFSGEISEEEWALLQIHMAYCDACHEKFLQYQQITSEVVPAMAAVAAAELDHAMEESPASIDAAERRLMSKLGSISPEQESPARHRFNWLPARTLAAVCAVAIAGLVTILFLNLRHHPAMQEARSVPALQLPPSTASKIPDSVAQQALQHAQAEIANLQQQLNASENRFKQANEVADTAQKQLETERIARSQLDSEKESLNQQLVAAQAEASSLRSRAASAGSDGAEQALRINTLESKVRELRIALDEKDTALSEKDRMLALDKDFLAHDRDIRDLIGARNLYIADIFDTTENGRTAKQFGRIFYTKDRSLVFYGFDLDSQASHKQNVSFQVWGSGSDRPAPVSLGLFYQDDTHKRWVLRCNDAKSLARLDMVFVTVEPPGGSNRPTGKPLLRAYLQIQPNHP